MSTTSDTTQYNVEVSAQQPDSGAQFYVQLTLVETSTFGDSDAIAMLNALVAAVPSSWGTPITQLQKLEADDIQSNYSATAGAFQ